MAGPMTGATAGPIVGVDVGGTFTDLILIDPAADIGVRLAKTPTTPDNQAFGVLAALEATGVAPETLDAIVHGTTTTTNALLERKLARTGLITTAGFRDVLEVGRRTRPSPYGMVGTFTPIIPRPLRLEVAERMDAAGEVLTPLDEDSVRAAVATLLAAGCEALVIHFLHAYANPAHERRAAEIAAETWPNAYITMGHALLSEYREYERGVTAAVNASVQPILERYVARLTDELAARGYTRSWFVMNGNGGMVAADTVAREAAKTVMSGPASGVMAAAYTARRAGFADIITYDMGGTSSDVALIQGAVPAVSHELEIEYALPIHVPMVDVRTIGAGGGSIARLDGAGMLRVGPESAGADPGPIYYGRGGTVPTVSDANLVLGRLNAETVLKADAGVSLDDVRAALDDAIAGPLGVTVEEAADAIVRVANLQMAGAIRMVSIDKGHDPRGFALFAFGGAGPLHAADLARELGIPKVLVPARPGITNALGCLVADLRHDLVNTLNRPLDVVDMDEVAATWRAQVAQGRAAIEATPMSVERIEVRHTADMQFIGQTHLLTVSVDDPGLSRADLQALFEAAYDARFHVQLPEIRANLVNLNTSVIGVRPPLDLGVLLEGDRRATVAEARVGSRDVWFGNGWTETPVYRRERLPRDAHLDGPAIVEQMDTTVVLPPGTAATADEDGNLVVEVGR